MSAQSLDLALADRYIFSDQRIDSKFQGLLGILPFKCHRLYCRHTGCGSKLHFYLGKIVKW